MCESSRECTAAETELYRRFSFRAQMIRRLEIGGIEEMEEGCGGRVEAKGNVSCCLRKRRDLFACSISAASNKGYVLFFMILGLGSEEDGGRGI